MFRPENITLGKRGQNRSRLEILSDMLTVVKPGACRTHVMYRANLSHKQLNKYLEFLEANGLVQPITRANGKNGYELSKKGARFLKDYSNLMSYFDRKIVKPSEMRTAST
jgi:predicted transcriptional regulator